MSAAGTWTRAVAGIVAKCEVAAKFNGRAVFNAEGANALGKLLQGMAEILDGAAIKATLPAGEKEK